MASLVDRAADVESRGAATTVRFTPASVTRALDGGATADELLEQLARLSRTPVPQALEYLVHDTERRHAALRVGAAGSYVRAADPAVLTGLVEDPRLADLGLIRLAPTVVAASVPAAALQVALRQRGLLAALEGPDGRPLGRLRRPARIERGGARTLRSPYLTAGAPTSDAERRALVERLRIADGEGRRSPFASTAGGEAGVSVAALDRAASAPTPVSGSHALDRLRAATGTPAPGDALALLRDAVREGGHVWLELVDGQGRPVRRRVRPLRVEAGRLRALDTQRGAELTVAVHRIAHVDPDDDA
ncbi:helicase-associated domain-containing protein [Xylanimonas protaetiae]|uniref:helicase-associated domain-containing protein n=1 Tax=Xylanimonas protaetiae TaxID=2509457 RepID=UPI001F5C4BB9|nr:helicase-associated domain-containing protein [Xylanimonas protaetiae]